MVGKGRRKTENKLVENKGSRLVCFSKRRTGLFKKAREISVLTGAQVGVLAFSPAGKPMTFDAPTLENLIGAHELIFSELPGRPEQDDDWESLFFNALDGKTGNLWWEKADVMSMDLEELQRLQGAILSYNDKLAMDAGFLTTEQQSIDGRFINASLEQESSFGQLLDVSLGLVADLPYPESYFELDLDVSLGLVPDLPYPESTFEQSLDVSLDLVPNFQFPEPSFEQHLDISLDLVPELPFPESSFEQHHDFSLDLVPNIPYPISTDSNVLPSDLSDYSIDNYIMNLSRDWLPELPGDEFL